jgi:cyclophilin family peptidyl-prolyl cis-trans isomerase
MRYQAAPCPVARSIPSQLGTCPALAGHDHTFAPEFSQFWFNTGIDSHLNGNPMKNTTLTLLILSVWAYAYAEDQIPAHPHVKLETTEGTIVLELEGKRAPVTVRNFLSLVDSGHYDGTIFHRVIPDFMIQGGGFTPSYKDKEPKSVIVNESGNGMSNAYGTIAMARLSDPHSASAQFFINVADNTRLDPSPDGWGYAVFGYVIEGTEVLSKIAGVQTGPGGKFRGDVPVVPIVLKKASRVVYD